MNMESVRKFLLCERNNGNLQSWGHTRNLPSAQLHYGTERTVYTVALFTVTLGRERIVSSHIVGHKVWCALLHYWAERAGCTVTLWDCTCCVYSYIVGLYVLYVQLHCGTARAACAVTLWDCTCFMYSYIVGLNILRVQLHYGTKITVFTVTLWERIRF